MIYDGATPARRHTHTHTRAPAESYKLCICVAGFAIDLCVAIRALSHSNEKQLHVQKRTSVCVRIHLEPYELILYRYSRKIYDVHTHNIHMPECVLYTTMRAHTHSIAHVCHNNMEIVYVDVACALKSCTSPIRIIFMLFFLVTYTDNTKKI